MNLNIFIDQLKKWEIIYTVGDRLSQREICHYLMSLKMVNCQQFHSYTIGRQFCMHITCFCTSWKEETILSKAIFWKVFEWQAALTQIETVSLSEVKSRFAWSLWKMRVIHSGAKGRNASSHIIKIMSPSRAMGRGSRCPLWKFELPKLRFPLSNAGYFIYRCHVTILHHPVGSGTWASRI